jgi:hypothetical protein
MKTYSKEEYLEARKVAIAMMPESNYLLISLSYSVELVMKYEDGIALLNTLEKAEILSGEWANKTILPIDMEKMTVKMFSRDEYVDRKTAKVLGLTYSEFKEITEKKDE